jgi:hypothetical protein
MPVVEAPDFRQINRFKRCSTLLGGLGRAGARANSAAARKFGNPQPGCRWCMCGTNGKGSVCAYLSAVLGARAMSRALHLAHLVSWRERIAVNEQPIQTQDLLQRLHRWWRPLTQPSPRPPSLKCLPPPPGCILPRSGRPSGDGVGLGGDSTPPMDRCTAGQRHYLPQPRALAAPWPHPGRHCLGKRRGGGCAL